MLVDDKIIIKPIKNLEELKQIKVGDIIGMGQMICDTIPALCLEKTADHIKCLGNMDGIIVEYNFLINKVKNFYKDGSLFINYEEISEYFQPQHKDYEKKKRILINDGRWKNDN